MDAGALDPRAVAPGILWIVTGTIHHGQERAFVAGVRTRVEGYLRDGPGLRAFAGGYRRESGIDRFTLVSAWSSDAAVIAALGERADERNGAELIVEGVADLERVEHYSLLPPIDGGIVDFAGGIVRSGRAVARPDRESLALERLQRCSAELRRERLLVAQLEGRRSVAGRTEIASVTVWPSLAALEAFAGPQPAHGPLYPELEAYLARIAIAHYQTIELQLGSSEYVPPRRVVAIRFPDRSSAELAARRLQTALALDEREIVIAPLGAIDPGPMRGARVVMVVRIEPTERFEAERLIADLRGELLLQAG